MVGRSLLAVVFSKAGGRIIFTVGPRGAGRCSHLMLRCVALEYDVMRLWCSTGCRNLRWWGRFRAVQPWFVHKKEGLRNLGVSLKM